MRWYVSYPILAAGLAFAVETLFPGGPATTQTVVLVAPNAPASKPIIAAQHEASSPAPQVITYGSLETSSTAEAAPPADRGRGDASRGSLLDYLAGKLAPLDLAGTLAPLVVTAPAPVSAAEQAIEAGWKSAVIREGEPVFGKALSQKQIDPPRYALTRDIQTELKRVGCYLGEIDGVWGSGSKRAILVFMDRVNASLPAQDPDVFMLSLLRAQDAFVCGATCPRGQSLAGNGRCVPSMLVAHARKPAGTGAADIGDAVVADAVDAEAASDPAAWAPVVTAARTDFPPSPYGRMGIGGPRPQESFDRRAALDDAPVTAETNVLVSQAPDEAIERPRAKKSASRSKSASRPRSSYRHVQRLFEHPLGRM